MILPFNINYNTITLIVSDAYGARIRFYINQNLTNLLNILRTFLINILIIRSNNFQVVILVAMIKSSVLNYGLTDIRSRI